jgi:hypothetical protein
MKSAWTFTVLALLAFTVAIGFAIYAGVFDLEVNILRVARSLSSNHIAVGLAVLFATILIVGGMKIAAAKAPKRSRLLSMAVWIAVLLAVVMAVLAVLNLDLYSSMPSVRTYFAVRAFESLVETSVSFGIAAAAAWLNLAVVAQGGKRAALAAMA